MNKYFFNINDIFGVNLVYEDFISMIVLTFSVDGVENPWSSDFWINSFDRVKRCVESDRFKYQRDWIKFSFLNCFHKLNEANKMFDKLFFGT